MRGVPALSEPLDMKSPRNFTHVAAAQDRNKPTRWQSFNRNCP